MARGDAGPGPALLPPHAAAASAKDMPRAAVMNSRLQPAAVAGPVRFPMVASAGLLLAHGIRRRCASQGYFFSFSFGRSGASSQSHKTPAAGLSVTRRAQARERTRIRSQRQHPKERRQAKATRQPGERSWSPRRSTPQRTRQGRSRWGGGGWLWRAVTAGQ